MSLSELYCLSMSHLRLIIYLHSGCRVLIGGVPSGIDRLGYLCLNEDDDDQDWMGLLEQVRLLADPNHHSFIHSKRKIASSLLCLLP